MDHPGHSHRFRYPSFADWRLGPRPESAEEFGERFQLTVEELMKGLRTEHMGNWNINIQGVGAHHNPDYPRDANKMAAEFVKQLQAAGHSIEAATFTHGAKDGLLPAPPAADAVAGSVD